MLRSPLPRVALSRACTEVQTIRERCERMPHLLLVDDDPEALEWLSELAKAEGFTVAAADCLRAARIHMSRLQPDILLTDLQLPDGKGVELVADLENRD